LHTNSKDEALALPTEASARLALRTQQVIAHESGVADTADPIAGSYYVESLTDEIEKRAEEYLQGSTRWAARSSDRGRLPSARDPERRLPLPAGHREEEGDRRRVNDFVDDKELPHEILRIDPKLEGDQNARARGTRAATRSEPPRQGGARACRRRQR